MEVGLRFVNSGASARGKRASSGDLYLKENGDLSMPEKWFKIIVFLDGRHKSDFGKVG